jgi:hypothetical protein
VSKRLVFIRMALLWMLAMVAVQLKSQPTLLADGECTWEVDCWVCRWQSGMVCWYCDNGDQGCNS